MAFMLVTLQRVKDALRVETDDDDTNLEFLISAASRRILAHLKGQAGDLLSIDSPADSPPNDLEGVPEHVAAAVVYLVGAMYRNPDNDAEGAFADGELPYPVRAMLKPLRDPTLA